jgi:hypothetical protein
MKEKYYFLEISVKTCPNLNCYCSHVRQRSILYGEIFGTRTRYMVDTVYIVTCMLHKKIPCFGWRAGHGGNVYITIL